MSPRQTQPQLAFFILACFLGVSAPAYPQSKTPDAPPPATPVQIENAKSTSSPDSTQTPEANPARPTVTSPAHIPPVGYLQFEQGFNIATATPDGVLHQNSLVQATKIAVHPRLMLNLLSEPIAGSRLLANPGQSTASYSSNDPGDLDLGAQGLLTLEHGNLPTVALAYYHRVRAGSSANLDTGSYTQSALLLVSGDVGRFHYDTNYVFNQQDGSQNSAGNTIRRAQFLQTLAISHPLLPARFSHNPVLYVELWHATQPLVALNSFVLPNTRNNAVGLLIAPTYALRPNLVLDGGFDHGLTSTSTQWQAFAGFTYLLPHRLWPYHSN